MWGVRGRFNFPLAARGEVIEYSIQKGTDYNRDASTVVVDEFRSHIAIAKTWTDGEEERGISDILRIVAELVIG